MTHEERQEMLSEARIYALAAPSLLQIIEKKKRIATEKLLMGHREGKTDHVALVAELSALDGIERDIKQKQAIFETLTQEKR
jgi:hypothetical protein